MDASCIHVIYIFVFVGLMSLFDCLFSSKLSTPLIGSLVSKLFNSSHLIFLFLRPPVFLEPIDGCWYELSIFKIFF